MRRIFILNLFLALFPSFAAATDKPPEKPNVILITLDTVRADRMGFLGSKRGLTPHLDALARQGVVFEHAYSQAPITPVSHATVLTGTFPQYHGIRNFGDRRLQAFPFYPIFCTPRATTRSLRRHHP
jgi:arylsulfatase A-like enzyme